MRHIVSCDGTVQFKQLVVVQIRQLVGFVRKICFHHYIRIVICKQVHHSVAKAIHFTSVNFKILVLVGCRRKWIWDVRKNNVHTFQNVPELRENERNDCLVVLEPSSSDSLNQCSPPGHCKYLCFSRTTVVQSRSRSKFDNFPLYLAKSISYEATRYAVFSDLLLLHLSSNQIFSLASRSQTPSVYVPPLI
jgi:hypothetical protein